MSERNLKQGPPLPPNAPSDWSDVVFSNPYTNLQRLGLWTGMDAYVPNGSSPDSHFAHVGVNSLGSGTNPSNIYVLAHGWAPGYRGRINQYGSDLLWWSQYAQVGNVWASAWAWSPVSGSESPPLSVNSTGVLQQIYLNDPSASVLAFSWIDDSATDTLPLNIQEVYASEAYTHLNGMRLANALQQAIDPSFFQNGGQLHLIGHSHGSKVCTVAAMTMLDLGIAPARLTVLDSPENSYTLNANGANLLPFYFENMKIQNQSYDCSPGIYVDSYASYFGIGYNTAEQNSPINSVVEVALQPEPIYDNEWTSYPGDCHTYAAAWYAAAASAAHGQGQPAVGLAWPPVPKNFLPAMNQNWPGFGNTEANQWILQQGDSQIGDFVYSIDSLQVTEVSHTGNVFMIPCDTIVFAPNGGDYSTYTGSFYADNTDQYGIAFDLEWTDAQAGDYFVVSIGGDATYTLLVLDGQSAPIGKTSVAINSTIWDISGYASIYMYFLGTQGVATDQVRVLNFRYVQVSSPTGGLDRPRKVAEQSASR